MTVNHARPERQSKYSSAKNTPTVVTSCLCLFRSEGPMEEGKKCFRGRDGSQRL
jgi:hypothetical protein